MRTPLRVSAAAVFAATALALTGCVVGPAPHRLDFGFRLDAAGNVVVAYPLCSTHEVRGAGVYIDDVGAGEDGDGFTTLWKATGPASEDVKRGVFTVAPKSSFLQELRPLKGPLPDGFYVTVTETVAGSQHDGRDHWVTPSRLKGKQLAADEWLTDKGKILTRDEINAQAVCPK